MALIKYRSMKPALIFDLDGTLWDASVPITESWNIVGRKHFGPDYSLSVDKVRGLMGKTMHEIALALTPANAAPEAVQPFVDECFYYERVYLETHPGEPFPEEFESLKRLTQDFDLFIVSNCQTGYIETFLNIAPKNLFLGHRCWSDTRKEKQFTIRLLMEDYGIEKAIYVGDTEKDESAAHLAGIPFIHAAYGFGGANAPEASINSLAELRNVALDLIKGLA